MIKYRELTTGPTAKRMVVMLHGLGSDADDLIALAPYLDLAQCYFFSPNGIEPCDMLGFGYQWFSLQNPDFPALMEAIGNAKASVMDMIVSKADQLDIALGDVILLGFSQGAMMSMYLALTATTPFHSVVAFSGRLILTPGMITQKQTPICIVHGDADSVVPVEHAYHASTILHQVSVPSTMHICKGLSHSIDADGLQFAKDFINAYS